VAFARPKERRRQSLQNKRLWVDEAHPKGGSFLLIMNKNMIQVNKLLLITYEYESFINGGVGRVINGLTHMLKSKLDFDIFLLNSDYVNKKWNAKIFKIKNGKSIKKTFKCELISLLMKLIHKEKYNLIHFFHSGLEVASIIKAIRHSFPAIKLLYSCHSISRYDQHIRNTCNTNVESEDYILKECDHLHLLNNFSLRIVNEIYPFTVKSKPISIIPNGIEEKEFTHISMLMKKVIHRKFPHNILVVCQTRWSFGKGLEYLLKAIPYVIKCNNNIRFIISGRKKKSWERGYADFINSVNKLIEPVKHNIIIFNWLNDIKRNTLFSVADLCVMPSLLEYFPYSILEPMICKVPIVSSRLESVSEILESKKEVLFYDTLNPRELAEKILVLAGNKNLQYQFKESAYHRVKTLYSWETIVKKYISMYRSIL
jgi:glycosyltransferase involved in cell wall biosynthesis